LIGKKEETMKTVQAMLAEADAIVPPGAK